MDLLSFINKAYCECLNESDEHTLADALTSQDGFLESDCDEQVTRYSPYSFAYNVHLCIMHTSSFDLYCNAEFFGTMYSMHRSFSAASCLLSV